jgi:hypothetical protein
MTDQDLYDHMEGKIADLMTQLRTSEEIIENQSKQLLALYEANILLQSEISRLRLQRTRMPHGSNAISSARNILASLRFTRRK